MTLRKLNYVLGRYMTVISRMLLLGFITYGAAELVLYYHPLVLIDKTMVDPMTECIHYTSILFVWAISHNYILKEGSP